jgi:hypothetical protein
VKKYRSAIVGDTHWMNEESASEKRVDVSFLTRSRRARKYDDNFDLRIEIEHPGFHPFHLEAWRLLRPLCRQCQILIPARPYY